jgi:hypothetical protein
MRRSSGHHYSKSIIMPEVAATPDVESSSVGKGSPSEIVLRA